MNEFATVRGSFPGDLLLALLVAFLTLLIPADVLGIDLLHDALLYTSGVATVLGTFFRRTHPVPAGITVYLAALVRYVAFPTEFFPQDVAVLLALYAVLAFGSATMKIPAILGACFGAFLLVLPYAGSESPHLLVIFLVFAGQAIVIATAAVALLRRAQYDQLDHIIVDAQIAQVNAERDAELAVVSERTRIAREMHDIVAHTLSVVIAQADGGATPPKTTPKRRCARSTSSPTCPVRPSATSAPSSACSATRRKSTPRSRLSPSTPTCSSWSSRCAPPATRSPW